MSTHHPTRKEFVLYLTSEMERAESSRIQTHMQNCPTCRAEVNRMRAVLEPYADRPAASIESERLYRSRRAISDRIQPQTRQRTGIMVPTRLWGPAVQMATAVVILLLGMWIGRQTVSPSGGISMEGLLTATTTVQKQNQQIYPRFASVEKLTVDPETGLIEIRYHTINDITLQARTGDPQINQLLQHTMLREQSPALRYRAVKATQQVIKQSKAKEPVLIQGLIAVLEQEKNPGIRLLALRILKMMPLASDIKSVLIYILRREKNPALRIEAFDALKAQSESIDDFTDILVTAQQDSNSYIRYQAEQLLKEEEALAIKRQNDPIL